MFLIINKKDTTKEGILSSPRPLIVSLEKYSIPYPFVAPAVSPLIR